MTGDSREGYDSQFLFPAEGTRCTCEHETFEHGFDGCAIDGCGCPAYWEHA